MAFVGSIAEPEVGELNFRADETTKRAIKQLARHAGERIAACR
jgi:hypothetical protein